jgi:hypothetical protein
MEKLEKLNYDTVILGGTLEALIHSYVEGLPLIMVNPQIPFYRDVDPSGLNKSSVWRRLSYYLSYAGLNPMEQKAANYSIEDNCISVIGKRPYKIQFTYNNIIRYDVIEPTEKLRVFDYIHVINLKIEHQEKLKSINTGEDFINHFIHKIHNSILDIAAVSYLTQEQLSSEEYGEVYARLKATQVLQQNDITGFKEIRKDSHHKKFHYIKTKTLKREFIFDNRQKEDILLLERKETKSELMKKITKIFGTPYAD